jgi:hypothetical protein
LGKVNRGHGKTHDFSEWRYAREEWIHNKAKDTEEQEQGWENTTATAIESGKVQHVIAHDRANTNLRHNGSCVVPEIIPGGGQHQRRMPPDMIDNSMYISLTQVVPDRMSSARPSLTPARVKLSSPILH